MQTDLVKAPGASKQASEEKPDRINSRATFWHCENRRHHRQKGIIAGVAVTWWTINKKTSSCKNNRPVAVSLYVWELEGLQNITTRALISCFTPHKRQRQIYWRLVLHLIDAFVMPYFSAYLINAWRYSIVCVTVFMTNDSSSCLFCLAT